MADDIIRVDLQLNPATVTSVENQVNSIVQRLNGRQINIRVNNAGIQNTILQLEQLEGIVSRLQNAQINVNANLTQQQQWYRLTTERMRVAQQLSVERERTLQTENRAVRALAEENRTMTINRNLTADINGNIQHTHEHIRNANNATNDFVTGLGRSLNYILQYRVITEILNQITEAYRELKAVDSSMVGYRKVTGASKSEVNALTKEAFSNALKYGRLASEYAESTERFAKAGYNDKSSQLSELALLSQNTGDIDNELANEFLVAADASWKLKGDVSELSNILDMFNELSNRTATDVEKLASGITVSGSMFAQAGLSAQDYAAIIGTATAKTQRSGSEMSRAWRTILMSLQQIRGTDIETGEVIDEEKLSIAEKTLNSVGIQIREIVNGQSELRNPMRVLGEIATKWESLSSIQQSALAESISNKRQSNAFISVIENWQDVEKAIEITANSSGSALRENSIYLDSWSAKSKQLSANWAEFISNMSNVEVIKGTLDVLSAGIDMLDTPIGKTVTQMILLNTTLALTGRLWQGVRAHSIVADILSTAAATGEWGTALQLVNGHLLTMARRWITSPMGMATIAVSGIMLLNAAVEKYKKNLQEVASQAEETAIKSASAADDMLELKAKLDSGTESAESLTGAFKDQVKTIPGVSSELKNLTGDYKDLAGAINEANTAALEKSYNDSVAEANAKGNMLKGSAVSVLSGDSTIPISPKLFDEKELGDDVAKQLEEIFAKNAKIGSQGLETTVEVYEPKSNAPEDIYAYYQSLLEIQDKISSFANGDPESEWFETKLYKRVSENITNISDSADAYAESLSKIKEAEAKLAVGNYLANNTINNVDAFNQATESLKNTEGAINVLNTLYPKFSKQTDTITQNTEKATVSLSNLKTVSESLSSLSTAFKELSDDGYITTKTLGEIKTATGLADDKWAQYEQKLLTVKAGSAEFNQVLSELTYKMLDSKFGTMDLTNATEEEIAAIETKIAATLRENGVSNASAVTHDYVAKKKEAARIKTKLLAGATYEEVVALSAEAAQAGITGKEFLDLVVDIGILNNTSLDPQQKIQALQEIGFYADWTAQKISEVGKVSRFSYNGKEGLSVYDKDGKLIDVKLFDDYTPPEYEPPEIPDFSSALKDSNKSDKDKTPFDDSYYSEVDSWLGENEKQIEKLEKDREALNRQFENALDTGNKEQAEILRSKLAENAKTQKDILHSQNEAYRITQGELLQSLYQYAPSLKSKSWDEISEVELVRIENELSRIAELASDDIKNQAQFKLNQFKGLVDDIKSVTDAIKDNSDLWWNMDEEIADSWRSTIDSRAEESERWISTQKDLNKLTVEEEIAAYKRIISYHKDYLDQITADDILSKEQRDKLWAEYYKNLQDYEVEYRNLLVDGIKNALQDAYDKFEERMEKRRKSLDFEKEQLSSLSTLLGKYHDVVNSISDEQHNITKELEAAKTLYEYLDEETRKLLFNQADYNALNEELVYLKEKANSLQAKYQKDIANATLENISEITSNYERQYDIMLKQYEIAKAELEVAKKRQQLDNVLAEKNVKMLIDGRWTWVAKTQDVINAQKELADAEYNASQARTNLNQTTEEHKLQSMINSLETTGNEMDAMLERRKNRLDSILESFEQKPAELSNILAQISASGVATISEICGEVGGALGDLYRSLTGKNVNVSDSAYLSSDWLANAYANNDYSLGIQNALKNGNVNAALSANALRNQKIDYLGLSETKWTDDDILNMAKNKYATGTKSTAPGLALMGENGEEIFISNNGHLIPINQPTLANLGGSDMVFNHGQMQNLWKWSDFNPSKFLFNNPQRAVDNSNSNNNNITINDMKIDGTSGLGKELADVLYRIKNMR